MIRQIYLRGNYAPFYICDQCKKPIFEWQEGVVVFNKYRPSGEPLQEGDSMEEIHAHKGACHDRIEASLGGEARAAWDELGLNLRNLIYNSGVSLKDLEDMQDEPFPTILTGGLKLVKNKKF